MAKKLSERTMDELFVDFFNELVEKIPEGVELPQEIEAQWQVTITGDGGGDYAYAYNDGKFSVEKGDSDDPIVVVGCDMASINKFRELRAAEIDEAYEKAEQMREDASVIEPVINTMNTMMPNQEKIDRLRNELAGTMRIEITDDDGNEAFLCIGWGGSIDWDEPRVTIKLTQADLEAMQSGELQPQQAFMGGKVQVEGDMSLAMQAAMIMMQP